MRMCLLDSFGLFPSAIFVRTSLDHWLHPAVHFCLSSRIYSLQGENCHLFPSLSSAKCPLSGPDFQVGCLYLRIWEECQICTTDQCDTCFLDTQDPWHGVQRLVRLGKLTVAAILSQQLFRDLKANHSLNLCFL